MIHEFFDLHTYLYLTVLRSANAPKSAPDAVELQVAQVSTQVMMSCLKADDNLFTAGPPRSRGW